MAARGVTWPFLFALTMFTARSAAAQPSDEPSRAEARKIGYAGVEAFQAGDFATAHNRLETAYQLLQVPSLGLWSARALAKLGKLVEAEARYLQVIGLPTSVGDEAIQAQARQDARNERAALARRIPSILVRVEGALAGDVAVTIDDAAVVGSALGESQLVNPGRHKIEGVRGGARTSVEVTVGEGDRKEALLRFKAVATDTTTPPGVDVGLRAEPGPPSTGGGTMRTLGWVTLGAGGAGLVVGAVTALVLRSKKSHLDSVGCGDGGRMCPASEAGNVDSYNSLRPVPGISLIAGAVLAGAGAYLLLTAPAPRDANTGAAASPTRRRAVLANVRLSIVPGGTMVSGEF